MRPVIVYEYQWSGSPRVCNRVEIGKGMFHLFGNSYEEFEQGPGNYTCAIVEMPDGNVIMPMADLIRFDDKPGV